MKPHSLKELVRQARDFVLLVDRNKSPALALAEKKRRLEKKLRARGVGRAAATAEASARYGTPKE